MYHANDCCEAETGLLTFCCIICHTGTDCVIDSCDPQVCCQTADVHYDNNTCTDDSCDGTKGCQFDTIVFYDANACTDDTCDSTVGSPMLVLMIPAIPLLGVLTPYFLR